LIHMVRDAEYGAVWCNCAGHDRDTFCIDVVTCSDCLEALVEAGVQAKARLEVVGYGDN